MGLQAGARAPPPLWGRGNLATAPFLWVSSRDNKIPLAPFPAPLRDRPIPPRSLSDRVAGPVALPGPGGGSGTARGHGALRVPYCTGRGRGLGEEGCWLQSLGDP